MNDYEKISYHVSKVSIAVNLLLSAFKVLSGFIAGSGAMVSDGVHSLSDVFSTLIVIIGVRVSTKAADKDHPYGHERLECAAAIVLGNVLSVTGILIGYHACLSLWSGSYLETHVPGILALISAVISIIVKEAMFWYTRVYARKIDSTALRADAWHHRSDALSSVGALIGIFFARMGFPAAEPLASVVICLFILKAAFDILREALDKLVDKACDTQMESAILACVTAQSGVLGIDLLKTRQFGNRVYVDLEILADATITLAEAHRIAERVHDAVEQEFPTVKHIMVHVNPTEEPN